MSIYTKTGDKGATSLFSGERVGKSEKVFDILGSLDELNSNLGFSSGIKYKRVRKILVTVQNDLFYIGSLICNTKAKTAQFKEFDKKTIYLEKCIDEVDSKLPKLVNFILPSGTDDAVKAHISRAVCRRAERLLVGYIKSDKSKKFESVARYLNRLSDLLFVLSRYMNFKSRKKEIIWKVNP